MSAEEPWLVWSPGKGVSSGACCVSPTPCPLGPSVAQGLQWHSDAWQPGQSWAQDVSAHLADPLSVTFPQMLQRCCLTFTPLPGPPCCLFLVIYNCVNRRRAFQLNPGQLLPSLLPARRVTCEQNQRSGPGRNQRPPAGMVCWVGSPSPQTF